MVTGGYTSPNYQDYVTEYQLNDVTETPLTPLLKPRREHACGSFLNDNGQQVLLVTGGRQPGAGPTSTTEVATHTSGVPLQWREVETGNLPTPRNALRATTVDNIVYVTGGRDDNNDYLSSILYWNAATESWGLAGYLSVARDYHGATAVPSALLSSEC